MPSEIDNVDEITTRVDIIGIDVNLEAISSPVLILISDVGEGCVRQPIAEAAGEFNATFLSIGDVENAVAEGDRANNLQSHLNPKEILNTLPGLMRAFLTVD